MLFRSLSTLALTLVVSDATALAQSADGPAVRPLLQNVTRVEAWSFFEPPADGGNPDYTLVSNRARLGVQVDARRVSFEGSFQYAQLLGLPRHAVGPGPLGPGALYFAAAGTPQAYQLYFKSMSLTVKDVVPLLSMQIGRMSYETNAGSRSAGRLIGGAEWTPFERSFDGVRVDYDRSTWRAHASFLMPTQGVFEESAMPTIGRLQLTNASLETRGAELFAHNYRDTRLVAARPDNTGTPVDRVDINVQTFGASTSMAGLHAWGAAQTGRWYGDVHRAFSGSVEAEHAWADVPWQPQVRTGVLYASGDADPGDERHGTFFPMVPTTRPDLLRGTFAQMNLRDIFAGVAVRPSDGLRVSADVHHLALADRRDRWYSGTGATAFAGDYFGFSTRRSALRTGLGMFVQLSVQATLTAHWTVSASTGVVRGGEVVRRRFGGGGLWVVVLESAVNLR